MQKAVNFAKESLYFLILEYSVDFFICFTTCCMIATLFSGYNVTILAYGQTGSGKTHSMGTADFTYSSVQESSGIIPRAITDIFSSMSKYSDIKFGVKVSFLEVGSSC